MFAGTHLYTWVKSDNVKLSLLSKETTRQQRLNSNHRPSDRKGHALTTRPPPPRSRLTGVKRHGKRFSVAHDGSSDINARKDESCNRGPLYSSSRWCLLLKYRLTFSKKKRLWTLTEYIGVKSLWLPSKISTAMVTCDFVLVALMNSIN